MVRILQKIHRKLNDNASVKNIGTNNKRKCKSTGDQIKKKKEKNDCII